MRLIDRPSVNPYSKPSRLFLEESAHFVDLAILCVLTLEPLAVNNVVSTKVSLERVYVWDAFCIFEVQSFAAGLVWLEPLSSFLGIKSRVDIQQLNASLTLARYPFVAWNPHQ